MAIESIETWQPNEGYTYTPDLIPYSYRRALGIWRFNTEGDWALYKAHLDKLRDSSEQSSVNLVSNLANPQNKPTSQQVDRRPQIANPFILNSLQVAIVEATSIGSYLNGTAKEKPPLARYDESFAEFSPKTHLALKVATSFFRHSPKNSLAELSKKHDLNLNILYTAASSVVLRHIDAFDAELADLTLSQVNYMTDDNEAKQVITSTYPAWLNEFHEVHQTSNPDALLNGRLSFFGHLIERLGSYATSADNEHRSSSLGKIATLASSYSTYKTDIENPLNEMIATINYYDANRFSRV